MLRSIILLSLFASASSFTSPQARSLVASKPQVMAKALLSTVNGIKMETIANGEMMSEETRSRSEYRALDLSKTIYTSSIKTPKDSYIAFAEKGAANAKLPKRKILHQSILGGCYVGFGGLLSLTVAGNIGGIGANNPGLVKMAFAALFPVNLLLIVTTGGQLFTGNSATVAAAYYEDLVDMKELSTNWAVSLFGNVIGCGLMAVAAWYSGLLTGGTAALCYNTAIGKCGATMGQNFVKAILCNWMVSLAVFLAGASNDLGGKLVAVWFPISTFVAIGLEHSVANLFIMPAAMLLKVPISFGVILMGNIIPAILGNAVAGALVVAGSYSYQFGRLGGKRRAIFAEKLAEYEAKKRDIKDAHTNAPPL
jgi:formate/nitrite transporter